MPNYKHLLHKNTLYFVETPYFIKNDFTPCNKLRKYKFVLPLYLSLVINTEHTCSSSDLKIRKDPSKMFLKKIERAELSLAKIIIYKLEMNTLHGRTVTALEQMEIARDVFIKAVNNNKQHTEISKKSIRDAAEYYNKKREYYNIQAFIWNDKYPFVTSVVNLERSKSTFPYILLSRLIKKLNKGRRKISFFLKMYIIAPFIHFIISFGDKPK